MDTAIETYEITGDLPDLRVTFYNTSGQDIMSGRLDDLAKQISIYVEEQPHLPDYGVNDLEIKLDAIQNGAEQVHFSLDAEAN